MKWLALVVCSSLLLSGMSRAGVEPCGSLRLHADGTWETGYGWSGSESPPPEFGAFAECYAGDAEICALVFWGTQLGSEDPALFDAFVWTDDGAGRPGGVVCASLNNNAGALAMYPAFSRFEAPLAGCCVSGTWWAGFRGRWPGSPYPFFFIGADLDGPSGGCPLTKVASGLGYPDGWQNVSDIWGVDTKSLAIGAMIRSCAPVPTAPTTWGRVKSLYTTTAR